MHEEYYSVANNLPTLCEITYDTCDIWLLDERTLQTPYRCRALSAAEKWRKYKAPPRDTHTSASLYNDPTTLGSRAVLQVSSHYYDTGRDSG